MKLRQFEKFENWIRKNYWSIFGMSEAWFNKEPNTNRIEYQKEEIQFMWEGWVASFRSNK